MLLHKLVPLFALGLNLLLLGTALASDRRSQRNVVFAYLTGCLAVWNLGVFGLRSTTDPATALTWEYVVHLGVLPIPVLFYHYVLLFLDLPPRRFGIVAGYTLCMAFLAVSPTALFITGVQDTRWGFVPASGPLYAPFVVYFQSYLVVGLARLMRAYRGQTSSFKRNRIALVIAGVLVSLLGGAVDFLRFILGWEWLYPLGIPTNAMFAVALGVAIVRYRLMNVAALVKRLVLYVITSAALAPVLFTGLYVADLVFAPGTPNAAVAGGEVGVLARDALILLLVFTVALPLLRQLELGLERVMFRRQHGVREALIGLGKELPSLLNPVTLAQTLTERLVTGIPAVHASLHLCDAASGRLKPASSAVSEASEEKEPAIELDPVLATWLRVTGRTLDVEGTGFDALTYKRMRPSVVELERQGVALVVPLFVETELRAVLVMGEKLSGEIYTGGEIEVLETLMGETAVALKNAELYQDLHAQMDELRRTQEQLFQTAKLAAIGELAAGVAHEVNSPLMVILGQSGLLLRDLPPDSPPARRISTIVSEANRAGKIVRDVLHFARRRAPNREAVSLAELIDRALALLESRLARARIEVSRCFDRDVPRVIGDRDQLTQVFINLIGNAVDAMPGGALTVETHLVREADGRGFAVAAITDTGAGIPDEHLERIFEPFYTTKVDGAGTGLGLSVSQGIVRAHCGVIAVESKPGRGTTMRVKLPLE